MQTLKVTSEATGIYRIHLNRTDKHNALSPTMMDELTEFSRSVEPGPCRAVILAANGPSFCAGGDLDWMRAQFEASDEERRAEATRLANMLSAMNALPVPLIAQVQGNAFGGGVGLMCVCDHVVAADTALFGLTETRLGLIPATIGPYVLAKIGHAKAREIFLSGARFGAERAAGLGLVSEVVNPSDLGGRANALAIDALAAAPGAVADAKALLAKMGNPIDTADVEASINALVERWKSDEARDGVAAFFDRAPPPWA